MLRRVVQTENYFNGIIWRCVRFEVELVVNITLVFRCFISCIMCVMMKEKNIGSGEEINDEFGFEGEPGSNWNQ